MGVSGWAKPAVSVALVAVLALGFAPDAERPALGATPLPNVVLILTDDQRWDTLWAMPNVRSSLVDHGVSFTNAFTVNPWCCPSRASILTGQPSHTNGVWRNSPPHGGFASFADGSTLATWLQDAGYRTGLVGKYLNGYERDKSYIPPGWNRWVAFTSSTHEYYGYTLSVDGAPRAYGTTAKDYSTDVLRNYATSFIRRTRVDEPLFLYFVPNAPHGLEGSGLEAPPPKAAPRHSRTFVNLPPFRPPSWNEPDVSDKPAYIQAETAADADLFRKRQYKSLLAVDDAVKAIVGALRDTDRLRNTMIVFASDNGFLWGEHRWGGKRVPYEESIRIPLAIRFDSVTIDSRKDSRLATTIDLAPTIAEAAGVAAPGAEGLSLMPALSGTDVAWRDDFLVEHLQGTNDPVETYCAVRNHRYLYAVYQTGERELYDLTLDPYQLTSVAADPEQSTTVASLDARLRELCVPPPPGFSFPDQ